METLTISERAKPGERLAALLTERGLSQSELARRCNLKQPNVYRAIRDNKGIGTYAWARIAAEFGVSLDYFFKP